MATKGAPSFSEQAIQLRSDYQKLRDNTNLAGDIIDVMYQSGKKPAMLYWYENDIEQGQCLLGRSDKNELVFEKLYNRGSLWGFSDLATYKRWLLQLVDHPTLLHARGIIHRDLRVETILFSGNGSRLVIAISRVGGVSKMRPR
ncbi:hypothetical protein PENDEC_c025G03111 [Penicillium decumbens]|uniref:Protein kinase domain-containing protein n=1 Tax=Penicillium decumbens TaxID=69771 RepID=A0A1V6P0E5_PENDC|nr:hypothetical protein PENDEC_c025G03111 [Penicillium decumbens]